MCIVNIYIHIIHTFQKCNHFAISRHNSRKARLLFYSYIARRVAKTFDLRQPIASHGPNQATNGVAHIRLSPNKATARQPITASAATRNQ